MTGITFTLLASYFLLALLIMSIKTQESKRPKREASQENSVSTSIGKFILGKCTEKVSCIDHSMCPEGYACLSPGFGTGETKSNKKCFKCNCMESSQCYFQDEKMLCNCSGSGYNGSFCETNIDDCETATCMNDGTCEDKVNDYSCNCLTGYTGKDCEININECENVTCSNKGICIDGVDSYTCQCSPGYSGTNCETSIDLCSPSPCVRYAKCTNLDDGYICTCNPHKPINTFVDLNASSTPQKVCSPLYPAMYPTKTGIQWNIVAEEKHNIVVKFTDFVTEECCDEVLVRDGPANETQFCMGVFSGSIDEDTQFYFDYTVISDNVFYNAGLASQLAKTFNSSANKLSILFISDSLVTYRGFCFTYHSIG